MKRTALLVKISKRARVVGVSWSLSAHGAKHDRYSCGAINVTVPRHQEINDYTAEAIMKSIEAELGANWWR